MFKFRNGWSDASSDWLPRRTCFRGGILLPARISCSKGRNFERSRCKVSQISTGYSEKDCLCMPLLIIKRARAYKGNPSRCNLCLSEKLCILTSQNFSLLNKKSELVTKCRHENKFFVAANQKKRRSNRS